MNNYVKFGILIVAILGTLAWLAAGGISDTKTYYKTIAELNQMGDGAKEKRLRVGGDIAAGSIERAGANVSFVMSQDKLQLKVVYNGIDPLPDTFRPGAQALADGKLGSDGVFHATKIQAKCASKYEAAPTGKGNPAVRSS
ncbi:MAG TPA: cytochrome c maturation protein CcmE [Bryobacteraceae bacterium]|nr:cytochrome c maturation protein CcmE [Bryobacteraceae bacterium]